MLNKISSVLARKERKAIYSDKVFLVSYPKSGNTWLSFIIANLVKQNDEVIDFHNVIQYVPELGKHDDILVNSTKSRAIKSHRLYHRNFSNVIYVVRDPRDVYVSYFSYLRKTLPSSMSFSEFLRKKDIYPSRWHTHVGSWLDKPNVASLIRYEDMLVDPFNEVCKILKILQIDLPNEKRITQAIEDSSFEKMRNIEVKRGRPFLNKEAKQKSSTFVRKGISGDWVNTFSSEDEKFLQEEASPLLERLGYI